MPAPVLVPEHAAPLPRLWPERAPLRPKVLFYYLDYGAYGGIEATLIQAARQLKASGRFEPVVVCCRKTPLYRKLREAGIRVHGIQAASWLRGSVLRMFDFRALRQAVDIIRREKPALINVHIGLLENLAFKALGLPVVYTVHGYGSLYAMPRGPGIKALWKRLVRKMFRVTARGMSRMVFVSAGEETRMRSEGFLPAGCPATVIPNGVDTDAIQHQAAISEPEVLRIQLGIRHDARCIAFINRLDANKNPAHFIELARRLSARPGLGPLAFLVVGDGPLAGRLKESARDLPNVYFLGHREDVPAVLALSELTVHTATHEGFGLGLLEAMAAGVPCLAYASEGPAGLLEGALGRQCLAPVKNLDALTEKALQLLTLPAVERLRLAEALQQRADNFDCHLWAERTEQLLDAVAPLVSVILPVYNGAATLRRAVMSVLSQRYPRLELLVVDDGSTDGTLEVLKGIDDSRLRVLCQANRGVAAARNRGFEAARGDYIAFIDADDAWLPGKLSAEVDLLNRHGMPECLVVSGYMAVDEQGRLLHRPPAPALRGDLSEAVLDEEGIFLPSTTLVHRRVFQAAGGFEPDCYHEDRAFFIRACQQFPVLSTGRHLVRYCQSESGRCRRILADEAEALRAELSIAEVLTGCLDPRRLERLRRNQRRNLCYRFLMYGQLAAARRLAGQYPDLPMTGPKGWLAKLSLASGINWLQGTRMTVQSLNRWRGGRGPC